MDLHDLSKVKTNDQVILCRMFRHGWDCTLERVKRTTPTLFECTNTPYKFYKKDGKPRGYNGGTLICILRYKKSWWEDYKQDKARKGEFQKTLAFISETQFKELSLEKLRAIKKIIEE